MWNVNISITNNTGLNIVATNSFLPENFITPNGGTLNWNTSDSPNVTSFKFWDTDPLIVELQSGLMFGDNCGVWADRGHMDIQSVIMDIDVNGIQVSQESNGGQTIVEDFSTGGNISMTFRNKL